MKTQQEKILALLQQAGILGINSYDLTYKYSCKQAPTRIKELKELGYQIVSKQKPNRSVQYILLGKSPTPMVTTKPSIQAQSWEEELIPVQKTFMFNGKLTTRTCYEKKEDLEQKGLFQ